MRLSMQPLAAPWNASQPAACNPTYQAAPHAPNLHPMHPACSRVRLQPAALCISRLEMSLTVGKLLADGQVEREPLPPLQIELYGGLVPKVE